VGSKVGFQMLNSGSGSASGSGSGQAHHRKKGGSCGGSQTVFVMKTGACICSSRRKGSFFFYFFGAFGTLISRSLKEIFIKCNSLINKLNFQYKNYYPSKPILLLHYYIQQFIQNPTRLANLCSILYAP